MNRWSRLQQEGAALPNDVMQIDASTAGLTARLMDYAPHLGLASVLPETASDDTSNRCEIPQAHFADQLLAALATMAVRSKRRQADLCAALYRAGLESDPVRVTEALRHLEQTGCIEDLVPLYDGGVLMSVTTRGLETLNAGPRWNMLDGAGFLRA